MGSRDGRRDGEVDPIFDRRGFVHDQNIGGVAGTRVRCVGDGEYLAAIGEFE